MRRSGTSDLPDPPDAPETRRRLSLNVSQRVGLPVLLAIPLLALSGLLGEREATADDANGSLNVEARWPATLRYRTSGSLALRIRNLAHMQLDSVVVRIDSAWTAGFSELNAVPPFRDVFELVVLDLPPGGDARVLIEFNAQRYGHHQGDLRLSSGLDSLRIPIGTRILP